MSTLTISCESCAHRWTVDSLYSVYEQQALESCPCPHCGAYTLCCPDPDQPDVSGHPRRRAARAHPAGALRA